MEINTTLLLVVAIIYVFVLPIIFRLFAVVHKKLVIERQQIKAQQRGDRQKLKNLPRPLWPKWKEHIGFTLRDKRNFAYGKDKETGEPKTLNITRKAAFFWLGAFGFIVSMIGALLTSAFLTNWWVILIGMTIFFNTMHFAIASAKPILKERKRLLDRMFSVGNKSFHYPAENAENPQSVITVLEWDDYVTPSKVEFEVPDGFGQEGEEGFLRQFNQIFGTQRTWVPSHDPEQEEYGWDYDKGVVTLYAVPPLPTMAPWHERYVLSPEIAWSFFPIALGVEHGVELTNPESGEIENVLGFDLSGVQSDVAKKTGTKVSSKIVVSPMALVAGGTGGGKSLSSDTMVYVVDKDAAFDTMDTTETQDTSVEDTVNNTAQNASNSVSTNAHKTTLPEVPEL